MTAALVVLWAAGFGCPATVTFVGDTKQFNIKQGGFDRVVPALEHAKSAADFYNYFSSSSHTGLEALDRSLLYLYRDLSNPEDNLALFWTHGVKNDSQLSADLWGRIRGLPSGTKIAVQDDNANEFDWHDGWDWADGWETGSISHSGPYIAGKWRFAKNTDGGAVDNISLVEPWTLEIGIEFATGQPDWNWRLYFGDGTVQLLNQSQPLYISYTPAGGGGTGGNGTGDVQTLGIGQDTTFCVLATTDTQVEEGTPLLEVIFDFGDSTTYKSVVNSGELACAHHSYASPGNYPVTVQANDMECSNGKTKKLADVI
eukprot:Hpha_TRINITY_DN24309_c0_g1::TRINITY_DN24309_c0_g1_i1::g.147970::m.147970